VLLCLTLQACSQPAIQLTELPESGPGGAIRMEKIAGRVTGAKPGEQVVLYAKSGVWWVQPFSKEPFTKIEPDSTFRAKTHLGSEYAALLVDSKFTVLNKQHALPAVGGAVKAVAVMPGRASTSEPQIIPKRIQFSGYDWDVTQVPSESGGVMHANSASNVWTDEDGLLHLRIAHEKDSWTSAELVLARSLGYGLYKFVLRSVPAMEPGTVLGLLTYDPSDAGQNHREIDIELSQWGDAGAKNAQFAIQPYYVPANVFRFHSPGGAMTHSFRWEPGRTSFESRRPSNEIVAQHVFTSGIPTPGGERVHLSLYPFGKSRTPQKQGVEVVIEKFEFLP
jgi:hypothetical protein